MSSHTCLYRRNTMIPTQIVTVMYLTSVFHYYHIIILYCRILLLQRISDSPWIAIKLFIAPLYLRIKGGGSYKERLLNKLPAYKVYIFMTKHISTHKHAYKDFCVYFNEYWMPTYLYGNSNKKKNTNNNIKNNKIIGIRK